VTRVCVVGCGAIGSLYAAHLARLDDVEVWAVDPWADHVTAIDEHGLRVIGREEFSAPVQARTSAADVPPCELGIVATKAEHTRSAVAACADVFADAAVASVQNGLGNEEVLAELVPRVIRGTILPAGVVTEPGVVRFDAPGDTWLGPFEPLPATAAEVAELAGLLERGGLPTHALTDARGPQWDKVVFNSATSPLAALTGLPMGPLCSDPALRVEIDALVAEAQTVCAALGIPLSDTARMVDEAIGVAHDHKPSMLQDVLARRTTEVDVLNGGIAAQGRLAGVPTPRHDAMVALVHGLERSWPQDKEEGNS
jgi:2-dehydropantoate 2-reductase